MSDHETARRVLAAGLVTRESLAAPTPHPLFAPPSFPKLPEGTRLGKFVLGPRIGEGGMSIVHRAQDTDLKRQVALKLLPAKNQSATVRLLREARMAARLDHPHIVPIYEVGDADGWSFIAMRWVDGRNLVGRAWDSREAVRIAVKLAQAVAAAHAAGVLHRDLKPSNVLIDGSGEPWLVDFGLARAVEQELDTGSWQTKVVGTPAFMAPEQTEAGAPRIDERTDVYGLGATLYYMLTGQPPFVASSVSDLMEQLRTGSPRRPRDLKPEIPGALEAILLRAIAREPADRYPTAASFAEALEGFAKPRPGDP